MTLLSCGPNKLKSEQAEVPLLPALERFRRAAVRGVPDGTIILPTTFPVIKK